MTEHAKADAAADADEAAPGTASVAAQSATPADHDSVETIDGALLGEEDPAELAERLFQHEARGLELLKSMKESRGPESLNEALVVVTLGPKSCVTCSLLFGAVAGELMDMVRFLVDDCKVDVDAGALYHAEDPSKFHLVSPLAYAACAGKPQVVKYLIERCASLGPGSLPLGAAKLRNNRSTTDPSPSRYLAGHMSPTSGNHDMETSEGSPRSKGRAEHPTRASHRLYILHEGQAASFSPGALEHALCHDTSRRSEVDDIGYCNPVWNLDASRMRDVVDLLLSDPQRLRNDWSAIVHPQELAQCPLLLAARHEFLQYALNACLGLGMTLGNNTFDILLHEASTWGNVATVHHLLEQNASVTSRSNGSIAFDGVPSTSIADGGPTGHPNPRAGEAERADASCDSETVPTSNMYTPLLTLCSNLAVTYSHVSRYKNVLPPHSYDPATVAVMLIRNGASVTARDAKQRTSLWHIGAIVDGEQVDHPPRFDSAPRRTDTVLLAISYHLYSLLQRSGAIGYMGPGAPSSMLNSSVEDSREAETGFAWDDGFGGNAEDCSICMEPLATQAVHRHEECGHMHHTSCLSQWGRNACPRCHAMESTLQYYP